MARQGIKMLHPSTTHCQNNNVTEIIHNTQDVQHESTLTFLKSMLKEKAQRDITRMV